MQVDIVVARDMETGELGDAEELRRFIALPEGFLAVGGQRIFVVMKNREKILLGFGPNQRNFNIHDLFDSCGRTYPLPTFTSFLPADVEAHFRQNYPADDFREREKLGLATLIRTRFPRSGDAMGGGIVTFLAYPPPANGEAQSWYAYFSGRTCEFGIFDPELLSADSRFNLENTLAMKVILNWHVHSPMEGPGIRA